MHSEQNSQYHSARNSLAASSVTSSKRRSKAEDPEARLGQRISDQAKIHQQAEQTDSGTANVYKINRNSQHNSSQKNDFKGQLLGDNSNVHSGLRRANTNYNIKNQVTGPIKPIHFDADNSAGNGDLRRSYESQSQENVRLKRTNTATNGKYCRALFAFNGRNQNELSFERGEVIEVLSSSESKLTHFGRTVRDSRFGSFPINVVELI